jgi:hypothetical protein
MSNSIDDILNTVGGLLTDALDEVKFSAGNSQTKVLSGVPFTVVGVQPSDAEDAGIVDVAPSVRQVWYSEESPEGTKVFFVPFDPTTIFQGSSCYADPAPFFLVPTDSVYSFYVKQSFEVSDYSHCDLVSSPFVTGTPYGGYAETITHGTPEIVQYARGTAPHGSYPLVATNVCGIAQADWGGGFFGYGGTYVTYSPILHVLGQSSAPLGAGSVTTGTNFLLDPESADRDEWRDNNALAFNKTALSPNSFAYPRAANGGGFDLLEMTEASGITPGFTFASAPP